MENHCLKYGTFQTRPRAFGFTCDALILPYKLRKPTLIIARAFAGNPFPTQKSNQVNYDIPYDLQSSSGNSPR